jgi:2-dehydro-3-deoxyphosphogluconate aldolase/(4S)-4-hydroxy-2-oxoglutarate aldolase
MLNNYQMEMNPRMLDLISEQGVLPLYYHSDKEVSISIMRTLYSAGIRALEYTNRGKTALANFTEMKKISQTELPGMKLGVGTIKNAAMAHQFIQAGADFLVSPGLDESVAEMVSLHQMLWIPGCMTPTEIMRAENLGLHLIKLFPGNLLGPTFVSAIKDIFPDLHFMPTGGVTTEKENLEQWFQAGVVAVGMGSQLISKKLLEAKDYDSIGIETKKVLAIIKAIKQ